MEPIDLMEELERQVQLPLEPPIPALEDPLSQMESILESQMENTVMYPNLDSKALSGVIQEEPEPVRGVRPPDPHPVEYDRTGLYQSPVFGTGLRPSHTRRYQPPLPGFGHIRSNQSGIHCPEKVYCEAEQDYVDLSKCYECDEWDASEGKCSYVLKRREEQEANDG